VPFIRQSRDKRGFEHMLVLHQNRHGQGAPRVLYLFRSPANLRVGRTALDGEVREALEHTHPDLNFDWNALTRDAIVSRPEPGAVRAQKPPRRSPGQAGRSVGERPSPAPAPAPPEPADLSPLAEVLGGAEAARLRQRHRDLMHRVGRRARTPEERARLLDRAEALRPDGWADEATIRARASEMDAECEAIARELPSRRRGRRGGRDRVGPGPDTPSGIMAEDTEQHDETHEDRMDRAGRAVDPGSDPGVGPAAGPAGAAEAPGVPDEH
jgi:hypothetical protein